MAAPTWTLTKLYATPESLVYKADVTVAGDAATKDITCTGAATPDLITDALAGSPLAAAVANLKTPTILGAPGINTDAKAFAFLAGGQDPFQPTTTVGTTTPFTPVPFLSGAFELSTAPVAGTAAFDLFVVPKTDGAGSAKLTVSIGITTAVCAALVRVKLVNSQVR